MLTFLGGHLSMTLYTFLASYLIHWEFDKWMMLKPVFAELKETRKITMLKLRKSRSAHRRDLDNEVLDAKLKWFYCNRFRKQLLIFSNMYELQWESLQHGIWLREKASKNVKQFDPKKYWWFEWQILVQGEESWGQWQWGRRSPWPPLHRPPACSQGA